MKLLNISELKLGSVYKLQIDADEMHLKVVTKKEAVNNSKDRARALDLKRRTKSLYFKCIKSHDKEDIGLYFSAFKNTETKFIESIELTKKIKLEKEVDKWLK